MESRVWHVSRKLDWEEGSKVWCNWEAARQARAKRDYNLIT